MSIIARKDGYRRIRYNDYPRTASAQTETYLRPWKPTIQARIEQLEYYVGLYCLGNEKAIATIQGFWAPMRAEIEELAKRPDGRQLLHRYEFAMGIYPKYWGSPPILPPRWIE